MWSGREMWGFLVSYSNYWGSASSSILEPVTSGEKMGRRSLLRNYLARVSPIPLSENLGQKKHNGVNDEECLQWIWPTDLFMSAVRGMIQHVITVTYPELRKIMSPPLAQAPWSLFLKAIRPSITAGTRGFSGSASSCGRNLKQEA